MPLPTGDTIGILADNLARRRSVLPIPVASAIRWTRGLDLPRGGERVLCTGLLYQLIPYVEGLVAAQEKMAKSPLAGLTAFGRRVNRLVNVSAFMAHPKRAQQEFYDLIPRRVALLLRRAHVTFGSLFEDDLYSGALMYDLGAVEVLRAHAQRVHDTYRKYGVREIITIDPHTTHMLRTVYPTLVPGWDIQVQNYLEVLAQVGLSPTCPLTGAVAIHDSCVFARYEGVVAAPRELLAEAGLEVREPEHAGVATWCCGSPVESLFPSKAAQQAARRVQELGQAAPQVVTMCPLCHANLQKAATDDMTFTDISEYLWRAARA